jgi:formylglycine-generating enzyme required for sulfatase activity
MGASPSEPMDKVNARHYVTLSSDYYMSVFPFTRGQYKTTVGSMPSSSVSASGEALCLPMVQVDYGTVRGQYSGALDYPANKGSGGKLTNIRAATGIQSLDLPTEAQWEYACRAGKGSTYYCEGTDEESVSKIALFGLDGANNTQEVGLLEPNAWGLYDMCGNMFEMCLDRYWTSEIWPEGLADSRDPEGPATDVSKQNYRVIRGGACNSALTGVASSCRERLAQSGQTFWNVGFRLCCPAVIAE